MTKVLGDEMSFAAAGGSEESATSAVAIHAKLRWRRRAARTIDQSLVARYFDRLRASFLSRFIGIVIGTVFSTAGIAGAASRSDPPRLVEWHLIGNIGLGMSATRIEYMYGPPLKRYADNRLDFRTYRGSGPIGVAYDGAEHAVWVSTDSPIYRSADGFGVGSTIPLGPCHRLKSHCVYRWRFLKLGYEEGGINVWTGRTRWRGNVVNVRLEMRANRVASVGMYLDRLHVCYPFYITCDGVR